MKKFTFILLALIMSCSYAMGRDILYLKDGSSLQGVITTHVPGEKIVFEDIYGQIHIFGEMEIARIERDTNIETSVEKSNANATETQWMAKKGYAGFVDVSLCFAYGLGDAGFGFAISTVHGYQFSHYAFLGAGIGYNSIWDMDIFAQFRGNTGKNKAQFTYGVKLGGNIYGALLIGADLGLRLALSPSFAMNFKAYSDMNMFFDDDDYFLSSTGLRIGVEF